MLKDVKNCLLKVYEFSVERRLCNKKDYEHVFNQAEKIVTSEFVVLYKKNTLGYARLGLAIAKKAIPKAVQRNRIKRLLRESFRIKQLPAVDIIFLARQGVSTKENKILLSRLSLIWEKMNLFCAD